MSSKIREGLDFLVQTFFVGCQAEWFKVVRAGDEFRVSAIPTEVIDLTRERTALQFLLHENWIFKNQSDEVVAIATPSVIVMLMVDPASRDKKESRVMRDQEFRQFSWKEVEEWYRLTEQEEIRGATIRYWEDVNVGDQLPPTHHVFTTHEGIAFEIGIASYQIMSLNWRFQMARLMAEGARGNPHGFAAGRPNPESGLPEFSNMHSYDSAAKLASGLPRANCLGMHLFCWMGNLVTNWMGDAGFLKKMNTPLRETLLRESLALCKGEVVKKYVEGNEHLVDLRLTMEDHNGVFPIPNGSATVALVSRQV